MANNHLFQLLEHLQFKKKQSEAEVRTVEDFIEIIKEEEAENERLLQRAEEHEEEQVLLTQIDSLLSESESQSKSEGRRTRRKKEEELLSHWRTLKKPASAKRERKNLF
jgi:hypothetical protein